MLIQKNIDKIGYYKYETLNDKFSELVSEYPINEVILKLKGLKDYPDNWRDCIDVKYPTQLWKKYLPKNTKIFRIGIGSTYEEKEQDIKCNYYY